MGVKIILDKEKQKKKRRNPAFIILGIIFTVVGIQVINMYSTMSKYKLKIYPQVWVEDISVGGKTKDEAKNAIIENYNNLIAKKNITIKVNDTQYTINVGKLDMKNDYINIIDKAYDIGRKENIFKNYFAITSPVKKIFQLNNTFSYAVVNTVLKAIVLDNTKKAKDAAIIKNDFGKLIITKEAYGYTVNSESLKKDIVNKVNNIEQEENLIIQPELKKIQPKIKETDLKSINTKLSSVTTNFVNSNENRSENIKVASDAINGKVLMPGDTFSFNDIVGERSSENGYKIAKGIIDNKLVDDLGGGVCQVSTTLYNAILRTNMASVERYHHTLAVGYIGKGLDATVAYGLLDYRFKNTYSYPIFIESIVQNKNVTFNVYSNSTLNKKKYDIVNEVVGDKVNVFKVTYINGKLLSKALLYTDNIA